MPANNKNNNDNDKIDDYVPYPVNGAEAPAQDNGQQQEGYLEKAKDMLASGYHAVADKLVGGQKKEERTKSHASCSGWNCPDAHAFSSKAVNGVGELFEHPEKFQGQDNCSKCNSRNCNC